MKPLTDIELDTIEAASRPLAPAQRAAFLRNVSHMLQDHDEIGVGLIWRICADLQRQFLNASSQVPREPRHWIRSRRSLDGA